MKIGDLTSDHIGRTITLRVGGGTATDQLRRVEHDGDIDEIQSLQNLYLRTSVKGNTTVTLKTFGTHDLPSHAEIEIKEPANEPQ